MEVDVASPSSSSGATSSVVLGGGSEGGKHATFGAVHASTSSAYATAGSSARKRGRNVDIGFDEADAYLLPRDRSDDDEETPAKRRNTVRPWLHREDHSFRSLGEGSATASYDNTLEDYEYVANMSDNGVDSPMHSLSLVSPSPSVSAIFTDLYTQPNPNDLGYEDQDMNEINDRTLPSPSPPPPPPPPKSPSHLSHLRQLDEHASAAALLPRQLRHRQTQQSSVPTRPSPLVHGRALSDGASSSSTGSSPRPASMDVSSSGSPHPLRKSVTQDTFKDARSSTDRTTTPARSMSQDEVINTPVRRMSRSERAVRTPSPRPQLRVEDDESIGQSYGEARSTRNLHHSPGLSQSSNFPSGKHMLRYTMGFRHDCELCRNKVAGHYGHVIHRSTSMNQ